MKIKSLAWTTTPILFGAPAITVRLTTQDDTGQAKKPKHHHYKLIDVGTFGGPNSSNAWPGFWKKTMNSAGAVVGEADTSTATDPYCLVDYFMNDAFQLRG